MPIIGIDLGTSNSAAVLRGGRPIIIPSDESITLGGKAFPSYVAPTAEGQMLVGEPARRQATINPEGTATACKRLMGRREKVRLRDREFSPGRPVWISPAKNQAGRRSVPGRTRDTGTRDIVVSARSTAEGSST